jgi:hypothetical protein
MNKKKTFEQQRKKQNKKKTKSNMHEAVGGPTDYTLYWELTSLSAARLGLQQNTWSVPLA